MLRCIATICAIEVLCGEFHGMAKVYVKASGHLDTCATWSIVSDMGALRLIHDSCHICRSFMSSTITTLAACFGRVQYVLQKGVCSRLVRRF